MKKIVLLLLSFTLFISCSDDDEPTPEPTVQEIQEDIQATFDGFVGCMQNYENGEFSNSLQNFFMINNGDVNEDYANFLNDKLSVFNFDFEDFSMDDHAGIYNWNSNTEIWSYTSNTTSKLEFNFPFSEGSSNNNTTITILDYEIESYVISGETEYRPLKFLGSIEKNDIEIFNIDLDNVSYRMADDSSITTNFDLEIRTSLMTHVFTLNELTNSQLDFNYTSHNDNSCNTTFSIDASTLLTDIAFVEDFDELKNISGIVGHGFLEVRFDAQNINNYNFENITEDEVNDLINANVFLNNSKIGHLEYEEINDNVNLFIVYNDETRENVENYIDDEFVEELKGIFSNFTE